MMEINPCPNPECRYDKMCLSSMNNVIGDATCGLTWWVVCLKCHYQGPKALDRSEALRLHTLISPQPSAPVQPVVRDIADEISIVNSGFAVSEKEMIEIITRHLNSRATEAIAWIKHGGIPAATTDPLIKMAWETDGFSVIPLYASPSAHPQPNSAALETAGPGVRYIPACEVTGAQREQAKSSSLYQHGDMKLVWVNEGDLCQYWLNSLAAAAQPQPEEVACPRCKQLRKAYELANHHLSCALEVIAKQLKERTE